MQHTVHFITSSLSKCYTNAANANIHSSSEPGIREEHGTDCVQTVGPSVQFYKYKINAFVAAQRAALHVTTVIRCTVLADTLASKIIPGLYFG